MSDLQKRGSYMPDESGSAAYQFTIGGVVTGLLGLVGHVLAVVGVIGATLPIIALVAAAVCVFMARRVIAS